MNVPAPIFHTLPDFLVRFSETDAAGLVHFTNFLRWAENAECAFFRANGLKIFEKTTTGTAIGFPRVSVKTEFRAPAHYADRIRVKIRPSEFPSPESRAVEWAYEIFRIEKNDEQTLLATGTWTSVFAEIEANGVVRTKKNLPPALLSALKKTFFS